MQRMIATTSNWFTPHIIVAFVIFGIGGLMRFRTELAASKHPGQTIMTTLIGHLERTGVPRERSQRHRRRGR